MTAAADGYTAHGTEILALSFRVPKETRHAGEFSAHRRAGLSNAAAVASRDRELLGGEGGSRSLGDWCRYGNQ
jgi:hypothetical protein